MRFIITKDHEELSSVMAQLMLKHMHTEKERVNISITTGETPVRGYQMLALQTKGKPYFDHVHYYIFDEFWYKDDAKGICRASLDYKYFDLADVAEDHIHNLDESNADTFDEDVQRDGGLDMVIMEAPVSRGINCWGNRYRESRGLIRYTIIFLMNFGIRMNIMRRISPSVRSVWMKNISRLPGLHRIISTIWIWKIIKPLIPIYKSREALTSLLWGSERMVISAAISRVPFIAGMTEHGLCGRMKHPI